MPADTTNESSQTTDADQSKGNAPDKLAEVHAKLAELIEKQNAMTEVMTATIKANKAPKQEEEVNMYDPAVQQRLNREATAQMISEERAKDATIYELSQEYPEIKTDSVLRKAVKEAQAALPESMRETAQGYETAILKAVAKAGIIAKSKRQVVDEDISMGSRGSNEQRPKGKVKISADTLAVAQLMGRDVSDPEVLKRLEAAAQRSDYTRYR